jgi:hypothetical protein
LLCPLQVDSGRIRASRLRKYRSFPHGEADCSRRPKAALQQTVEAPLIV